MENTAHTLNNGHTETSEVSGKLVTINNETYYKISNSDAMRPFFMSMVSDSNHWLFISSNGGLTAGRKNAEFSLFPYYTDDKITESADITGSKTILQVSVNNKTLIWEPFSERQMGVYKTRRNLFKNIYGNKILFEEINEDLGLTYQYEWNTSDKFGFVKKATLINNTNETRQVKVLDGLQNILPASVDSELQNSRSNLVDAYKRSELEIETGLGIYALSAVIVDKAEPSEALKANIVWSVGFENPTYLLSSLQLNRFRKGLPVIREVDVKAEKGAYFGVSDIVLTPKKDRNWLFVAEVNQSSSKVINISQTIKNTDNISEVIQKDINQGTKNLIGLTGAADGLQLTADPLINTRHFANTLFNIMRGGIFDNNYQIEKGDFIGYINKANKNVYFDKKDSLNALPEVFTQYEIIRIAEGDADLDFKRLCFEYLPLKFSRRHGDPSRPWNKFSINTRSEKDGSKILDYQGNWRDIFQNWEALAHSYPEFIEGMIHKFLNASTFEGYNPYRVTKDGFDWEIIEENDPWSYIGYWGDHQIIYLLKFLEFIEDHYPNRLEKLFNQNVFVFANVPYKIKSYEDILNNPKDTIDFDHKLDDKINKLREEIGADGALLRDANDRIYRANFIEKILVTVLAKVSNFIPEGGIWLNTQRPEWNDANNALVGNGVSMVTLYYLNRFLNFFENIVEKSKMDRVQVSTELITFFNEVMSTLKANAHILNGAISNKDRKSVLDGLGKAGSNYRNAIYQKAHQGNKQELSKDGILEFIKSTKSYLHHTIDANKRGDHMYHAYNLMTVQKDGISISYLSEMLEGQVAVLSSGHLTPTQSLQLLDGLKNSALFREDQYSYILYPNKDLPGFKQKNNIPEERVEQSKLLSQLMKDGITDIHERDILGHYHFNSNFNNANSLKQALLELPEAYESLVKEESHDILDIFEAVFDHKSFTGRSGTFFGYEGLGSIYWHMVSKLLLAVQENCLLAILNNESQEVIGKLLDHYYEINAGIGVHKSPELYGAFPTDPYSHTPATKGAQQPGMTGQVKEDVLSRFGELGVFVRDGRIVFNPVLLQKKEFLTASRTFHYTTVQGMDEEIILEKGELGFTYCQIPVIYRQSNSENLTILFNDSTERSFDSLQLDEHLSKQVFERLGIINRIVVSIIK